MKFKNHPKRGTAEEINEEMARKQKQKWSGKKSSRSSDHLDDTYFENQKTNEPLNEKIVTLKKTKQKNILTEYVGFLAPLLPLAARSPLGRNLLAVLSLPGIVFFFSLKVSSRESSRNLKSKLKLRNEIHSIRFY